MKQRIAVLISGRGSNMQSLAKACKAADYPAEISIVISNKADALGLEWAKQNGLKTQVIDHRGFADRTEFEHAIIESFHHNNIDIVCLAGFMRVLSPHFFKHWRKPVLNIHPSLLPKHKGLNTHQAALDAGDAEHGCSVHIVTEDLDGGEVILQKKIKIQSGDNAETLAARVLEQEHLAYPEALKMIADRA